MALAERRPVGVLASPAAPTYNQPALASRAGVLPALRSISPDLLVTKKTSSVSSRDLTPPYYKGSTNTSTSTSTNTNTSGSSVSSVSSVSASVSGLSASGLSSVSDDFNTKKAKLSPRVPIATGISTTIPVTGEKPKPDQEGDALLEDDVLYAIFLILYEHDRPGAGMTVKQICDVLVARHPDMAQLLSKTSNLVSAKLNAYVKRVEKGDANLKYALLREWADALPKRMVYVYRGLLAKDFHVHVRAMERPKVDLDKKNRRQTMVELPRPAFLDRPDRNLFVPYLSAPVAASFRRNSENGEEATSPAEKVGIADSVAEAKSRFAVDLDVEFDDLVFDSDDDDGGVLARGSKRSKSMSALPVKKAKFVTAAAAAPRAPKTPCSHSVNAAAAGAALHAAALQAISGDWAMQRGFLTQEIGAPEDLSLSELEKMFS